MDEHLAKLESEIKNKITAQNLIYEKKNLPPHCIEAIYNIFFHDIVDETNDDAFYLTYLGVYYDVFMKKKDLAEKYYLLAAEKNSQIAMNNIAILYECDKNFETAEKYYLMAIGNGNSTAAANLASMYYKQKNYDLAEKYYLQAIQTGHVASYNNIAELYIHKKQYNLAEKYFLQAIELGIKIAIHNLAQLYHFLKKYDMAEKYYLLSVNKGKKTSLFYLGTLYYDCGKYETAMDYYLRAADNGSRKAIAKINFLLGKKYDIGWVTKANKYLDKDNQKKFNDIINFFKENRDGNFKGRLMENMDCVSCNILKTNVLFLHCGHCVCIECFKSNAACKLCTNETKNIDRQINTPVMTLADIAREVLDKRLSKWRYLYMPIPDEELVAIYNLFFKDIVDENNMQESYLFYLAIYYYTCRNSEKAMPLNIILFEKENVLAMVNLAIKYEAMGKYTEAEKYYLMAIAKNNSVAMYHLAALYLRQKRKDSALKYYLMAANEYNRDARSEINDMLNNDFVYQLALQAESYLTPENTNKLNQILTQYVENREYLASLNFL